MVSILLRGGRASPGMVAMCSETRLGESKDMTWRRDLYNIYIIYIFIHIIYYIYVHVDVDVYVYVYVYVTSLPHRCVHIHEIV